jgi:guanine deaminase
MEERFMRAAIELATENVRSGRGGPFGAVIVRDGQIIASGANCVTSSNDVTAHAEIVAIRNACKALASFQLSDCDLYTSCEPCPMCMGAIYWARPKNVYFGCTASDAAKVGFDDSLIYEELRRPLGKRRIPMIQALHDEALAAFEAWERKSDRIPY